MEKPMSTKKFIQLFLLAAMLLTSLASTTGALAASSCGSSYTVVSGDTLRLIAGYCDTNVAALRLANPAIGNGNLIYPDQVLMLPGAMLYGNNGYDTYIVARGDTLKALAIRFNTNMDVLGSLNGLYNYNLIYEGQRLTVPSGGSSVPPAPGPVPGSGQAYTVQRGDTLRKIAARANTSVDAILQLNPQIWNANVIYVGQIIVLPASASTYIVQYGDTLKIIAARFGTTYEQLLALNPQIANPNLIYVGQTIYLR
jgi:N-acetylmuramoyl-L-alanine amidase